MLTHRGSRQLGFGEDSRTPVGSRVAKLRPEKRPGAPAERALVEGPLGRGAGLALIRQIVHHAESSGFR